MRVHNFLLIIILVTIPITGNSMDSVKKGFKIKAEDIRQITNPMGYGYASDMIMIDGKEIMYMYRELPDNEQDSGWRFFSGYESQEYVDDTQNLGIYDVNTIANYDTDIVPYLDCIAPCSFEKKSGTNQFIRLNDE